MSVMILRLPNDVHEILRLQAAAEHVSANELVVRTLRNALSARRQLRDDLIEQIAQEDAEIFARLTER